MPILNRQSPFTVSILKGSNKIISSSEDNFQGLRPGSYIKLGDIDFLYLISKISKFFYIKDFTLDDLKTLIIKDDIGVSLAIGDIIKISFKEYGLETITNISNKGKNYQENDILTISGGNLSIDVRSGEGTPTKLIVQSVNENGEIESLGLQDEGKYIIPPKGIINLLGGNGEEGQVELVYSPIDNRSICERTIKNINISENHTKIILDYSLSVGLREGKLSVEKYEISLNSLFLEETARNINYQIFRDYTSHLLLPLLVKNSYSSELIINKAFWQLDAKIKELEDKINSLI